MATPTNRLVENTFKYVLPTTAIGISGTNMMINASRHNQAQEYQAKQLQAMTNLTNSLNKVDESMQATTNPVVQRPSRKRSRYRLTRKTYSLDNNDIKFRRKVDLEGILGDRKIDELRDWLLEKSLDPRLQTGSQYSTEDFLDEVSYSVSINDDPRSTVVNLLYSNGVLEILFVDPKPNEISKIDGVLDEYCSEYDEEVGYIATQPARSIFHVEIKLKEGTESEVPEMLHEENFKINVLINKNK